MASKNKSVCIKTRELKKKYEQNNISNIAVKLKRLINTRVNEIIIIIKETPKILEQLSKHSSIPCRIHLFYKS